VRRLIKFILGAVVLVVLVAGGLLAWYVISDDAPSWSP